MTDIDNYADDDAAFQNEDYEGEYEDMAPEPFNLNELEFDIKSTDMSENTITFIVEKTILAFEADHNRQISERAQASKDPNYAQSATPLTDHERNLLISKYIKEQLEQAYEPAWHVIVGDNYGAFFTHEHYYMIVFKFKGKWITVFKSNRPVSEND